MLRECGKRLSAILEKVVAAVRPGIATKELDGLAEGLILSSGGAPVFKGYRSQKNERPFPGSICVSINNEVVHGIPSEKRILSEGDIVGIDIGMRLPGKGGLITDMAVTIGVGRVSPAAEKLLAVTKKALSRGVAAIRPGARMGDLGHAIQEIIESNGFGVVRDLVGHGVGERLHEDPYVPNYGMPGEGILLNENMVIAIEPMATLGDPHVVLSPDGWAWHTRDGSLAAHFEHTVLITKEGAEILTR